MLIYKAAQPEGVRKRSVRTWIHRTGRYAALIEVAHPAELSSEILESCVEFLQQAEFEASTVKLVVSEMRRSLLRRHPSAKINAAVSSYDEKMAAIACIGDMTVTALAELASRSMPSVPAQVPGDDPAQPPVRVCWFTPDVGETYVVAVPGMDFSQVVGDLYSARNSQDMADVGSRAAGSLRDWGFLVFPMERKLSLDDLPYDPFLGQQEERPHEMRGLHAIARALFEDPDFKGFRIVGGNLIPQPNTIRLPDGILVSPWGVVILELKDWEGSGVLSLASGRDVVLRKDDVTEKVRNPFEKMAKLIGNFRTHYPLRSLRNQEFAGIGTIVFTHPEGDIKCLHGDGRELPLPVRDGGVILATPAQLSAQLKEHLRSKLGKKVKPLDEEEILKICEELRQRAGKEADGKPDGYLAVGEYLIESKHILSTGYYKLHQGITKKSRIKVMAKMYIRSSLCLDREEEKERLGREWEALQALSLSGVRGVQRALSLVNDEGSVWVILEHVGDPSFEQWLQSNPPRKSRIDVLRRLALLLGEMGRMNIVHRALDSRNIRIRTDSMDPVLTNFELCRLDYVFSIDQRARTLFDTRFQAPETAEPGQVVSGAADVYSLGKLVLLALGGKLFFDSPMERNRIAKAPGGWEKIAKECGLPSGSGTALSRLFSGEPEARPTPQEFVRTMEDWA